MTVKTTPNFDQAQSKTIQQTITIFDREQASTLQDAKSRAVSSFSSRNIVD